MKKTIGKWAPYVIAAIIVVVGLMALVNVASAVGDCDVECRTAHEDDYNQCLVDCKERNQASVVDRINETQVAWGDYCASGCADVDVWDYPACKSYCNSNNRASVEGTQTAYCVWGPRGYMCAPQSGANSVDDGTKKTKFASSIRIGDPKPACGTDAWACFNGTDDESPMIRDVGIFGVFASNHPCMHPSCD